MQNTVSAYFNGYSQILNFISNKFAKIEESAYTAAVPHAGYMIQIDVKNLLMHLYQEGITPLSNIEIRYSLYE